METWKSWTVFVGIIILMVGGSGAAVSDLVATEQRLHNNLMANYANYVIPIDNATKGLNVSIGITAGSLILMDERRERLTINAYLFHGWNDQRLAWKPEDYSGITLFPISVSKLWVPDIVPYNSEEAHVLYNSEQAVLANSGEVIWMPAATLKGKCEVNLVRFPFDQHTCTFTYGSWTSDSFKLRLNYVFNDPAHSLDVANFKSGKDWTLVNSSAILKTKYYPCCPEPYTTMDFTFVIKRNPLYFVHVYILPAVILSLLVPFQLFLPPESKERLTLGAVLIPSNILMILKLQDVLPLGHSTVPAVGFFYSISLVWSFLALLATILVLNFHNRGPRRSTVPDLIRLVFLRGLKRVVCLGNDNYYSLKPSESPMSLQGLENPVLSSPIHTSQARESSTGSKLELDVEDVSKQVRFLAARSHSSNNRDEIITEWHQVALVIDRILFFLFFLTMLIYTTVLLG